MIDRREILAMAAAVSLLWPDRILNGGKVRAGQRITFTASTLLFRRRSFYLYRLAIRVETFAKLVSEGITARV